MVNKNEITLYCVVRNTWILYLDGEDRTIDDEIIYATTSLDEICEKFDISDRDRVDVNKNKLRDLVEIEGMNKKIRADDVEVHITYYIDYKTVNVE